MIQEQRKHGTISLMSNFLNQTINRIIVLLMMVASNEAFYDPTPYLFHALP